MGGGVLVIGHDDSRSLALADRACDVPLLAFGYNFFRSLCTFVLTQVTLPRQRRSRSDFRAEFVNHFSDSAQKFNDLSEDNRVFARFIEDFNAARHLNQMNITFFLSTSRVSWRGVVVEGLKRDWRGGGIPTSRVGDLLFSTPNIASRLHLSTLHPVMPIQRVPRYELLIADLVKHTPEGHPDADSLQLALYQARACLVTHTPPPTRCT